MGLICIKAVPGTSCWSSGGKTRRGTRESRAGGGPRGRREAAMSAHLSVQLVGHIQVLGSVGAGDAPGPQPLPRAHLSPGPSASSEPPSVNLTLPSHAGSCQLALLVSLARDRLPQICLIVSSSYSLCFHSEPCFLTESPPLVVFTPPLHSPLVWPDLAL